MKAPALTHLYVHIPFCRSRCAYCDFASEPVGPHLRAGRVDLYVELLRAELRDRLEEVAAGAGGAAAPIETIYLGGGTPIVLPAELLLPLVAELAALQAGAACPEFTIEANPGTIDAHLLGSLAAAGVTRVSLGVQSFAPELRSALGRRTEQREIEAALTDLRGAAVAPAAAGPAGDASGAAGAGPREWNIDLVFGIPGQTWAAAAADIDAAVAAAPTHISLYDLTYTASYAGRVTRNCAAGAREAAGDFAEEYLSAAAARLAAAGYLRYEVSNFALPGHECRHNQAYWQGEDYLGVGTSAVSTLGWERRTNPASVAGYLAGEPPDVEVLDARTRLWEKAMLGLRTAAGVVEAEVLPVLDKTALDRLISQDCVTRHCGRLRLNPGFLDVSNSVIAALLASPEESQPV